MSHPTVSIAPFVGVDETNEDADVYAEAVDFLLLVKDNFSYYPTFPSVETARQYNYTKEEKETVQKNRFRMVVGDMESVKSQINHMITQFNADEVLFVTLMRSEEHRLNSSHVAISYAVFCLKKKRKVKY